MNIRMGRAFTAFLLTASFAIATQAHAQNVYNGAFTLPVAAHWGNTLLEPGQYTVSVLQGVGVQNVIVVRGHRKQISAVLTGRPGDQRAAGRGRITLQNVAGTYVISRFDSGVANKSFIIPVSKRIG